jgi:hypothetical protein
MMLLHAACSTPREGGSVMMCVSSSQRIRIAVGRLVSARTVQGSCRHFLSATDGLFCMVSLSTFLEPNNYGPLATTRWYADQPLLAVLRVNIACATFVHGLDYRLSSGTPHFPSATFVHGLDFISSQALHTCPMQLDYCLSAGWPPADSTLFTRVTRW